MRDQPEGEQRRGAARLTQDEPEQDGESHGHLAGCLVQHAVAQGHQADGGERAVEQPEPGAAHGRCRRQTAGAREGEHGDGDRDRERPAPRGGGGDQAGDDAPGHRPGDGQGSPHGERTCPLPRVGIEPVEQGHGRGRDERRTDPLGESGCE